MINLTYKTFDGEELPVDLYLPPVDKVPTGAIVFFFGGGWNSGTIKQFEPQAEELSALGLVVACPEYRVFSKHGTTTEVAIKDAVYSTEYFFGLAARYGFDRKPFAVGGASAGAHLALATVMLEDFIPEHFRYRQQVKAIIANNPVTDAVEFAKDSQPLTLSPCSAESMSPLHNIKPNFPDVILFHGNADTTVPFSTAVKFAEKYNNAGNLCILNEYDGYKHGFFNAHVGGEEVYKDVLNKSIDFLKDRDFL